MQLPKENVQKTWWPVTQYILLLVSCTFLFFIPVVIAFPEFFNGSREEFRKSIDNQFWFHVLNQVVGLSAAWVASWAIIVRVENSSMNIYGFTVRINKLILGFSVGAATMLVFVLIGFILGLVEFSANEIDRTLFQNFILFFFVAITEEVIIRGYLLYKLRMNVGDWGALLLTSCVFGVLHFFNDHFTWIGFINISLSGILMGLFVIRTTSLSSAIGIHWAWNFVQGSVFGFAVSGKNLVGILSPKILAPDLMGGDFGIEGSVLLIPITLIFILLVYKYLRPS